MMPMSAAMPRTKATPVERFVGILIDGLVLVPVYFVVTMIVATMSFVANSPFLLGYLGTAICAVIAAVWFLMRDAMGLSFGKKIMGLEVLSKDGGPATQDQLKKRNFTLAAAQAGGLVPFVGGLLALAINLYEAYMIFTKGERYGDQMANTIVVKKAA